MPIDLYPSVAKVKRNGAYQNLPGFVQQSGDADIEAMIANKETSTTAQFAHAKDSFFILNDVLYQADADIPVNGTIAVGTNCHVSIIGEEIYDYLEFKDEVKYDIGIRESLIDCNNFVVGSGGSGNWAIDAKSKDSVTIRHKTNWTTGAPELNFQLNAGKYILYADFSQSTIKNLKLKIGTANNQDTPNGKIFTVENDSTNCSLFFTAPTQGTYTIEHICICLYSNITRVDKLMDKTEVKFVLPRGYINVDFSTNKISIPAGYINVNNNARIPTSAKTLDHGGLFYFLYYDLSANDFVLSGFQQPVDFENLVFVASIPDNATDAFVSDVPFAINGVIRNRNTDGVNSIGIAGKQQPIILTNNRTIIFPRLLYINNNGMNYNISMANDFEYDYKGAGNWNLKTIYIDTSMLDSAVSDGLSNNMFYVKEQAATTVLDPKYKLIAIIPDSFIARGVRPYTVFDYVTIPDYDRKFRLATGFIPETETVTALYGNDAIADATAYDQGPVIIALWDSLMARANQYGTYVQKCWIDGTPYDDTEKIMSDEPTAGDHNPRNDMNQYPLIMYKFIPETYPNPNNWTSEYKPKTKRLLVVSGIHGGSSGGDHLESPIGVYYFAKRLVEEFYLTDSLVNIRNNYEIDFIPLANPWGINNKQRVNGQNVDINRDFEDFQSVTAQQIKILIDSGVYDIVYDSHCLGGTSLTTGDLAEHSFVWMSGKTQLFNVGKQVANFIGAKYSLLTGVQTNSTKTLIAYANSVLYLGGMLTEVPANTPLYYGDTTGDVHGQEVVKRAADFIQNVIAVVCNYLLNY